jgi:hypothetical protein
MVCSCGLVTQRHLILRVSTLILSGILSTSSLYAQQATVSSLPDAPLPSFAVDQTAPVEVAEVSSSGYVLDLDPMDALHAAQSSSSQQQGNATPQDPAKPQKKRSRLLGANVDEQGHPIPLENQQPTRILGFMPNFRTVSAGATPHPLGWKYNFQVATKQAFDYSSFAFLGLTSLAAEGLNEHPVLGKGVHGFYSYTWRGLLDKTDGTYLSAWLLPSLLHEDTRYHPLGHGHKVIIRALYVISRQGVAQTYGGRQTPNIAGLGGKVLTQVVSREYYPTGATSFGVLAEKFGYATMRDVAFTSIREFYPDIAAYYIHKHDRKVAAQAAADAAASGVKQ